MHLLGVRHDIVDPPEEDIGIKGLPDKVGNAYFKTPCLSINIFIRSEKNNRSLHKTLLLLQFTELAQSLESVHDRHLDIEKYQIRHAVVIDIIKEGTAGLECGHTHVVFAQDVSCHLEIGSVVVNDDNPFSHN